MSKPANQRYRVAVFLFRRDLRLIDNRGLNRARQAAERVLPLFVLDPRQTEPHPYRSLPGLAFMQRSLRELDAALTAQRAGLWWRAGEPQAVLQRLIAEQQVEALFVNRDFTPFSRRRDQQLAELCQRLGCAFHSVDDLLLQPPEQTLKADGTPYRVFTPYYRNARQLPLSPPDPLSPGGWLVEPATTRRPLPVLSAAELAHPLWRGGRQEAVELLAGLDRCDEYAARRERPAEWGTTGLSAHLKFGTCSCRELQGRLLRQFGEEHPLLRQLHWRDFFTQIAWHHPAVFGAPFDRRFSGLAWDDDAARFEAWCAGETGVPLVDAGMRELNQSGYMHNRVRMLAASFLVKDLQLDWRWGERYFAQRLTDYDPCVNNGNWQWVAGTGCDAQPWFRIFNPWRQQQRFDPEGDYIRRWVPQLAGLSGRELLALQAGTGVGAYPAPLVEHGAAAERAKQRYQQALAQAVNAG